MILPFFRLWESYRKESNASEKQDYIGRSLLHIGEENENFLSELDEDSLSDTDPIGSLLVGYLRKHRDPILPPE